MLNLNKETSIFKWAKDLHAGIYINQNYIPELFLENLLKHLKITLATSDYYNRKRPNVADVTIDPSQIIELDENIQDMLRLLRGPIHLDPSMLKTDFVSTTSKIQLSETKSSGLPRLTDINTAISELKAFIRSLKGKKDGRLIIGEKGAGKTTLTHYTTYLAFEEDHSVLFLPIDYQWVPFFETESEIDNLTDLFFEISKEEPVEDPEELLNLLKREIKENNWDNLEIPTLKIRNKLNSLMNDRGLIVQMYCHFMGKKDLIDDLIDEYDLSLREDLIKDANEWMDMIRKDPRALLVYCLTFELEREKGNFIQYSWSRLIASMIRTSWNNKYLKDQILAYLPERIRDKIGKDEDIPLDIIMDLEINEKLLTTFGSKLLAKLSDKFKVVMFFDNVDAKFSVTLETRILRYCLSFLQNLSIKKYDVIMCVRNRTYSSTHFKRLDLEGSMRWRSIQTQPPDLASILRRKVQRIRISGMYIGESNWWFWSFLNDWINGMIKEKYPRNTLDIIEQRCPNDVRGQLDLFCTAATSMLLHRRRTKIHKLGYTSWANITPEFCLRALIQGKEICYAESNQNFVPNIYNNGFIKSPFNAMIRPLLIGWIHERRNFSIEELTATFTKAGIPEDEVENAIENARDFSLIRESYEDNSWFITHWGRFFHEKVAFELPYIQTVWWDIPMLEDFSVGFPKILEWNELEELTQIFERWLYLEEEIAKKRLNNTNDLTRLFIWKKVTTNIAHALNRIEQSVGI